MANGWGDGTDLTPLEICVCIGASLATQIAARQFETRGSVPVKISRKLPTLVGGNKRPVPGIKSSNKSEI